MELPKLESFVFSIQESKGFSTTHKIEIVCSQEAAKDCLVPLLNYIQQQGDVGHGVEIMVDGDSEWEGSETEDADTRVCIGMKATKDSKVFFYDGDGASRIASISVSKTEEKKK